MDPDTDLPSTKEAELLADELSQPSTRYTQEAMLLFRELIKQCCNPDYTLRCSTEELIKPLRKLNQDSPITTEDLAKVISLAPSLIGPVKPDYYANTLGF